MSTSKNVAPEFKGATLKMYNLLKQKGLTHAAVMAFKKANDLRSAYQILFRLRRFGLKTKAFTITATGDTKPTRTYRLVKGVAKGVSKTWPKANPVRTEKPSTKKSGKKATAKKATAKKSVAKKTAKASPKTKKLVAVGASDDDVLA